MRGLVSLVVLLSTSIAAAGTTGTVAGKVTVTESDGKVAQNVDVIVYLTGPAITPADPKQPVVSIEQKDKRFVPDLVAVTIGGSVSFPNRDLVLHNVFSQSPGRKFDLGSYKKNESKTQSFEKQGVIDVYCNVHPEMAATILVLPNRYHAHVDLKTGAFSLKNVPAGTWKVFAYTRRATKPVSVDVKVVADTNTPADLTIVRGAEANHLNKYGSKYPAGGGGYPR